MGRTGPGRETRPGLARRHDLSASISAASAVISRAAALSGSISDTSRPVCMASAKTTRWPTWCASRSEEYTSELQSLMRISYAVFCLKKKKKTRHRRNLKTKHISGNLYKIDTNNKNIKQTQYNST